MKREAILAIILWLLLTAVGEILAVLVDFYPVAKSDKGEEIERAFRILLILAIPVFTMVVTVTVHSVLRHRAADPSEDGVPLQGKGAVPVTWVGVTAGLTLLVIVFPGLTSLPNIVANPSPDLVVEVKGVQWTWLVSYPDENISNVRELVLPVDRQVRFEITSADVLHSFWVPAFLMKIDAVPGKTTTITLRPTHEGSFETDPLLRVQCAELCGLSHARMQIPVRVVTGGEYQEWVAAQKAAAPTPGGPVAVTVEITAKNLLFDKKTLEVPAGQPFAIKFKNQDPGVPHNVSIYTDASASKALFTGDLFAGIEERTYQVPALDAGSYFFRCDVHPGTMTGTLIAK